MTQLTIFGDIEAGPDWLDSPIQHFLASQWRMAAALFGDPGDLRRSSQGHYGSEASYQVLADGVGMADHRAGHATPDAPACLRARSWPLRVTWAETARHAKHFPAEVRGLRNLESAGRIEARRHWDANAAINPSWYRGASDEQRAELDAEMRRHVDASRIHGQRVRTAVLAMLPLAEVAR